MKVVIFLVSLFLVTSGYFIRIPISKNVRLIPDKNVWARNQRNILSIFKNICDEKPTLNVNDGMDTTFSEYLSTEFLADVISVRDSAKVLPKQEIFTELNSTHLNELRNVYQLLIKAKSFNEFYAAAALLKDNVNCELFIDAFYAALLHRNDTENMMIPSPYEVFPNYFIKKDAIIKGILLLFGDGDADASDGLQFDGNVYTLETNYTSDFYNDQETKMSYFLEDVGLNAYYFMQHLEYAPWTYEANPIGVDGADSYHLLKQLLARYELERYANGLSEMQSINWDSIEAVDYDPMLLYSNGEAFPRRITLASDHDDEHREYLKNIEDNVIGLVVHLRQSGYSKSEIMNHLMDILFTGERSYEKVAIRTMKAKDNISPPSVLEHYSTKLRDPVYWQIMKKILEILELGLGVFENYTRDELYCPGVQVLNVEVKKAMTYFDLVSIDVTDALKSNRTQTDARLIIKQPRLNHKEFSLKLNISLRFAQKVLIKMYLSPCYQSNQISSNIKNNYVQLHSFETVLKAGNNVLTVTSGQMNYLQDFASIENLLKKVEDIEYGMDEVNTINLNHYTQFPSNLMLPKGSPAGLSVKLLVFIAPIFKFKQGSMNLELNTAILSPGYPFDAMANQDILSDLPNAKFKEILITHKGENKVAYSNGMTKKWPTNNSYDFSSRATYDYASKKGTYDYSSKKDQYSKGYYTDYTRDDNPEVVNNENILLVKPFKVTETGHAINSGGDEIANDNYLNSLTTTYSETD